MRAAGAAIVCLVELVGSPARGDAPDAAAPDTAEADSSRPVDDRQGYVRVDGGFASAVGAVGVSFGYSPVDLFALEAGVGYGPTGVQVSLMPRLQMGDVSDRFVLGLGVSVGIDVGGEPSRDPIPWINGEFGYEHRWDFGLCLSVAAGYTHTLTGGDESVGVPLGRVGVGYWF